jgi:3-hydroxybutyrate dehydrogenase
MSQDSRADGETPVRDRRALVTGGASGIGLAIATRLAERGARVVLSDVAGDRLESAAAGLAGAVAIEADLGVAEDVHRLAEESGDIDILVNNAGLQHVSPVESFGDAEWRNLVEVMLTAPFLLIKDLIPGMYERGWGRIINIASVHGLVASPFKSAYVAAKHGLLGLTKTVALEAAAHSSNVTVHAICPSYVRTPLVDNQVEAQAKNNGVSPEQVVDQVLLSSNAIKKLIEPADVAAAVEFLCGEAAWSMTGSALTLDAGWLAH